MQTTLTTSHWRTLQEILLQQMEQETEHQVSVLLAGMSFVTQGVQKMLQDAPWIRRAEVLSPQDEERFDVTSREWDVIFLTTPGTSRLLGRLADQYHLLEGRRARALAGVGQAAHRYAAWDSIPQLYPGEVIAADLALRATHRERRRQQVERGAQREGDSASEVNPPGLVLMHISGAISREDIAISRGFGRPVSLHIRDGAKTVRTGVFAAAHSLTYCSPHAFSGHPGLFVRSASPDGDWADADDTDDTLPVADPALWQMLAREADQSSEEQ